MAQNNDVTIHNITLYAVCFDPATLSTFESTSTQELFPEELSSTLEVYCPAGTELTGGGFWIP